MPLKEIECNDPMLAELMATVTLRKVLDRINRALQVHAAGHRRSTNAAVREVLEHAMKPDGRVKLGSLLASTERQVRLDDKEFSTLEGIRERSPAIPVNFAPCSGNKSIQ
jgi:antitoxin FitA